MTWLVSRHYKNLRFEIFGPLVREKRQRASSVSRYSSQEVDSATNLKVIDGETDLLCRFSFSVWRYLDLQRWITA